MDGICQIHQGNGLAGFGLLFQIGYRGLLTIVDDTVNHAVVIFRGHFRCLQVVLFLEIRQLFETHAVAVMDTTPFCLMATISLTLKDGL